MSITRIGVGKRMSEAVIHGGKVYLAGLVADKAAGKSVKEQTADILSQIDATLAKAKTEADRCSNRIRPDARSAFARRK